MGSIITMVGGSSGGTQNALVQMDVPMNGLITGVDWSAFALYDTTLDELLYQLSFGSESTTANDSRQVISMLSVGAMVVATAVGSNIVVANKYVALPDLPVGIGERIFLHAIAAASVVGDVFAMLHFSFDMSQASARRR